MCFVYLELGFNEKEIASFFQHSHCRFISGADLNKRELDWLSGSAMFIKLTNPPKNMILNNLDIVVVNHSSKTDSWLLNEDITQKLRAKWLNSGISYSIDYVKSAVPCKEGQTFELNQQVYIEHEGSETENFLTVIIRS
ncbi:hypothetical protein [Candidatus Pantoea bituminis]|uniref:hypothetical protein n=1 Tax=Candidatus Pantoea bituminis TaxID=2831036 RepID=UPI001C0600DF|nr:hypothetical protein [Pantoea bituminis]